MAVTISNVIGSSSHGGTLTITGSGFGSKAQAAPAIWDPCTTAGADISAQGWTGWLPSPSQGEMAIQYRNDVAMGRGVAAVHQRNGGSYLCGRHGDLMCGLWKHFTLGSFPYRTFESYWHRCDPNWQFGSVGGSPGAWDDNYKFFNLAGSALAGGGVWYSEVGCRPTSPIANICYHTSLGQWQGTYLPSVLHPMNQWVKYEIRTDISDNSTTARHTIINPAVSPVPFITDTRPNNVGRSPGQQLSISIGGFSSNYISTQNYRYWQDVYIEIGTLQRVIFGNANTLSACTIREMQIPTAWSDTSITVRVNRGVFSNTPSVYVYVFDANEVTNSLGFPIPIGETQPPAAPSNLRIS